MCHTSKHKCSVLQLPLNLRLVYFVLQSSLLFLITEMYSIQKNAINIGEMSRTAGNLAFVSAFVLKAVF